MKILCLGDVVGKLGCEAVRKTLPSFRRDNNIDMVIANGENSAEGNGILPNSAEHLFTSGVDIITGGNHSFRRREIYEMLDSNDFLLRPYNYPDSAIGHGICLYDMGRHIVAVINLIGCVYMESQKSPFDSADKAIEYAKKHGADTIIVDFHAEATAEKRALAFYLDGKVSAFCGTHTHVQTNDNTILPNGTGYITDLGMCGPELSVLGVKPELAIDKMRIKMPVRFENAQGRAIVNGCIFDISDSGKKCTGTEKVTAFC